ncbi:MAG TPA: SMP-30/gluconolactonase/LRE family protein [Spirochaetia bacterium]|nr:SMP-30/gluconolactonase/LRE family protein [Spirochaetia bacterium]
MRIELLIDERNNLGEGPVWDVEEQRLYWIDSLGREVFRVREDGSGFERRPVPGDIGSLALRKSGGLVLSLADGFYLFDFDTGRYEKVVDPEPHLPRTRLNDGKVDKRGRFIAGTMDTREEESIGSLYRLDTDLTCHRIETGIKVTNGPCWSPDGKTFYFADSWTGIIRAYDYDLDHGTLSRKRTFASTTERKGAPDGSTVDAEGYLWNAQVYGGYVVRYAPDGTVDRVIEFPITKVTSVNFGGKKLDVLYVTTMGKAAEKFAPTQPKGGGLFAIHDLGVTGVAEPRFGG